MRRPTFAVSLSFALVSLPLVCTAQHVAPAVVPVPAMHSAPIHTAPVGAARGTVHPVHRYSPVSSNRTAVHSAPAMNPPVRTAGTPNTPAPNTPWHAGSQSNRFLPTYPPQVPDAPVLLPGNIFSGQSCFLPYNCYPVPGNGFDYSHFFATHPNWGSSILTAGVIVPFSDSGGFYVPVPYYYPPQVAQEEEQGPPPPGNYAPDQYQGQNQSNNAQNQVAAQQPSAPSPAYSAPSEPVYEYVFVKRDSTKIFAVAYLLTKDNLQYVTKEGLRRTLPLTALDFEATQKSNEERGNTITLPLPPHAAMATAL